MRRFRLTLGIVAISAIACGSLGLRAADKRATIGAHEALNARFVGRWVAERMVLKGNELVPGNAPLQESFEWIFERDTYVLKVGDGEPRKFKYRVDTSQTPWHFDIEYVGEDPQMQQLYAGGSLGICRFVEGKFERCYCQAGANVRPTKFESTVENEMNLVVLTRAKPAEPEGKQNP